MAQLRVTLGIGFANAHQEDIIDIDDYELSECESDEEREALFDEYWQEWSSNYIDGGFELID